MLKEFLWRTFENTGNVDAYIFYKEVEEKNKLMNESTAAKEEAAISNLY